MLDWRVQEHEGFEGEPEPRAAPRSRMGWRAWLWLLPLLGLMGLAVVGGLRWRVQHQEATMRTDLARIILQEERARAFGQREQVERFALRDAPQPWREAYAATFQTPEAGSEPTEVTLEAAQVDGSGVLATVQVGHMAQLRAYRLTRGAWRRVPVPDTAWGVAASLPLPDGMTLYFRERDRAFAEELAADLPALLATRAAWPSQEPVREIRLEPMEFGPLLTQEGTTLTLNSPLLAPAGGLLDGSEAVRHALAEALFARAERVAHDLAPFNAARADYAARTIVAMRWALTPDTQARLRAGWRAALHPDRWRGLFLNNRPLRSHLVLERPDQDAAESLLTLDFLFESQGAEAVAALLQALPTTSSWDTLLFGQFGQYAVGLDRAAQHYARSGTLPPAENAVVSPLAAPFVATGMAADTASVLLATVPGYPQPVRIEVARAETRMDGEIIQETCLRGRGRFRIEGDWREPGRTLIANHITIEALTAPDLALKPQPAPTDTLALAMQYDDADGSTSIIAVDRAGQRLPLLADVPSDGIQVVEPGPHMVLLTGTPNCAIRWVATYDTLAGKVGTWAALRSGVAWVEAIWREASQDFWLLLRNDFNAASVDLVRLDDTGTLRTVATRAEDLSVVGWDAARSRLLVQGEMGQLRWLGENGAVVQEYEGVPQNFMLQQLTLAPDGETIFFYEQLPQVGGPSYEIRSLNLRIGEQTTRYTHTEPSTVSTYHYLDFMDIGHDGSLIVLEYSQAGAQQIPDVRLLHFPAGATVPAVLADADAPLENGWPSAVLCADGSALYTPNGFGATLHLQRPDGSDVALGEPLTERLYLYACAGSAAP